MRAANTSNPRVSGGGRRSFIAVPLPADVRAALFGSCEALAGEVSGVKWQRKIENLHVTIKFLGNISDDRIRELAAASTRALAGVPSFEVGVRGIGAFPSVKRANVIWAGIDDATGGLGRIAALVETAFEMPDGIRAAGRESRPFRAHVTLGRAKSGVDVRAAAARLSDQVFGRFAVNEAHLYESQLGRAGSTYILHARMPLVPAQL